ncbi:uncharacterized protein GLRG_10837 [Colletotrichum graminicola M1.001]|uniref:Uncharacterized protein n=1 Tax=Colletotrichum graminicola (strain M1.001 / M2 / FGSC 10212) TaxID=645133 RepID=E3QXU4_COLGM|nr:uncharacterized protein GLRG_10837 [Colletotrichum graminicola M1.001]EFQ35682.1 hypothetical protein GLRG_10837 [Colletotrichum graminicola M1.001]
MASNSIDKLEMADDFADFEFVFSIEDMEKALAAAVVEAKNDLAKYESNHLDEVSRLNDTITMLEKQLTKTGQTKRKAINELDKNESYHVDEVCSLNDTIATREDQLTGTEHEANKKLAKNREFRQAVQEQQ